MNAATPAARLPWPRLLTWSGIYLLSYGVLSWAFRFRAWGQHHLPPTGPVLLLANHQSFLDPLLVGVAARPRPFHSMARVTLWRHRLLGQMITLLNGIPVDQEAPDLRSMRRCLEVLRQGHALLVFPEGSRTEDGAVAAFAPGVMMLVRRALPMVVPVGIEGAYTAWPRHSKLPRVGPRVGVEFGPAWSAQQLLAQPPAAALAQVRSAVDQLRLRLRERLELDEAAE